MKIKELVGIEDEAKNEISEVRNEIAKDKVKASLLRIEKAKSIVSDLEKKHKELLDMETSEIEFDDFEY